MNRGGGFNNPASNARSGNRNANTPENRNNGLGLRPANVSHRQIAAVDPREGGDRRAVHVTPRSVSGAGLPSGRTWSRRPGGRRAACPMPPGAVLPRKQARSPCPRMRNRCRAAETLRETLPVMF